MSYTILLIPFFPLLGSLFLLFLGQKLKRIHTSIIGTGSIFFVNAPLYFLALSLSFITKSIKNDNEKIGFTFRQIKIHCQIDRLVARLAKNLQNCCSFFSKKFHFQKNYKNYTIKLTY